MKLRNYVLVTAGYWTFTLTDGALRMLVLLYFNELGYSPVAIAFLFLAYEFMGIVTNLIGGWVGARTGLNRTLLIGLGLQVVALVGLTFQNPSWAEWISVVFVMSLQALSGVAKDLTKMSSKSAVKYIAGEGALFRLVAILTGSKNALKGLGFFLGAVLLSWIGYDAALWSMAIVVTVVARRHRRAPGRGHRSGEGEAPAAVDPVEVDGDQPSVGRSLLPLRVARHLVRRCASDLLRRRTGLAVRADRRVPRRLVDRVRHRAVVRTAPAASLDRQRRRRDRRRADLVVRAGRSCRSRWRSAWRSTSRSPWWSSGG